MFGIYVWKEENGFQISIDHIVTNDNKVVYQYMSWFENAIYNGLHMRIVYNGKETYCY